MIFLRKEKAPPTSPELNVRRFPFQLVWWVELMNWWAPTRSADECWKFSFVFFQFFCFFKNIWLVFVGYILSSLFFETIWMCNSGPRVQFHRFKVANIALLEMCFCFHFSVVSITTSSPPAWFPPPPPSRYAGNNSRVLVLLPRVTSSVSVSHFPSIAPPSQTSPFMTHELFH